MRWRNTHNHRTVPEKRVRAVIYSRVAVAESKDRLVAYQEICRVYAQQKGLTVVAEFADVGLGLTLQRDGLARMRTFISSKAIGAVIIPRVSCLTRSVGHLILLRQEFEAFRIHLHVAEQEMEGRL